MAEKVRQHRISNTEIAAMREPPWQIRAALLRAGFDLDREILCRPDCALDARVYQQEIEHGEVEETVD